MTKNWSQNIYFATVSSFLNYFSDLLFPSSCVCCGSFGPTLCENCLKDIGRPIEKCIFCDLKTLHGITCSACRRKKNISGVISIGSYGNTTLKEAVHSLKFAGVTGLSITLGNLLSQRITILLGSRLNDFVITPLPLHPKRERERGFNQARLLANEISKKILIPSVELLKRVRSTEPQASLNAKIKNLRSKNISGAFAILESISQKMPEKVIIIDDVSTTGATLEEAARTLKEAGVKEIWGAVVCRG